MRRFIGLICAICALIPSICSCYGGGIDTTDTQAAPEPTPPAEETTSLAPPLTDTIDDTTVDTIIETISDTTEALPGLEAVPAEMMVDAICALATAHPSYLRRTETVVEIDLLGNKSNTRSFSELRVSGTSASFKRDSAEVYLADGELYYETSLGKCRVRGYDRAAFLGFVSDEALLRSFIGGDVAETEAGYLTSFCELGEDGKSAVISMLALGEGYDVSFGETTLELLTDGQLTLISSRMSIALSVSLRGERLMEVAITIETRQSDTCGEVEVLLPDPSDYFLFTSPELPKLYSELISELSEFAESHGSFEYSFVDDMLIGTGERRLELSSRTVFAYDSRIGASIEKVFDNGDGAGMQTTLTHFNNRHGFSQINGGSIFVDSTVNAGNLMFTLSRPFALAFFPFESCIGMDEERSDGGKLAFTLTFEAAESIASNLLMHAGVAAKPSELSVSEAYTYIEVKDGGVSAVGYIFDAIAQVNGKEYRLTRSVELEMISKSEADVKVIYIEVDDEAE